jgi:quercetin dioxygenase-like cupin family protein
VVVLRGRGQVRLGGQSHEIGFGDTVYVAPREIHQFRNLSADEPFGFLCVVDAQRDQPVLRTEG